ncbi:hypothetical protein HPB52_017483 [Rhipicephalus sanguineus]|uniref:Uncharacterized protein n=1 Tax=Rhipicephalus sanguineus TaxID=34632 RepID=A0A9D4QAJ1_RHISA|nr:hypothetical protein HPB52_017483 [Rhipicephalus sanguineus]
MPQFYNLTDSDLRRALNGYLPDDSQFWPEDEIVNLQPEFFLSLDSTYLSLSSNQESFKLFLGAAAMATASFFARSLRRPGHGIFHVPGISKVLQYRLLVNRELSIKYFLTVAPLYGTWEPTTVISALLGTSVSVQFPSYIRFSVFFNDRFQLYSREELGRGAGRLLADVRRLELIARAVLPNASAHEIRDVYDLSYAAHVASYIPRMPEWLQASPGERPDASLEKDRIFFYLVCYAQCGTEDRERLRKMAACNVGLPAVPLFRKAFKCRPRHHLVKNFTWPEPPETTTEEP